MVHFLLKSHMNRREFDAMSQFTKIHNGLISALQKCKLNVNPKITLHTYPSQDRHACMHDEFNLR